MYYNRGGIEKSASIILPECPDFKYILYIDCVNTEIGYNSQGYYLYIGPPEHDLTLNEDALIIDGDIKYQIDRAEKIKLGEEVLYVWAVVRTVVDITE